MKFTKNSCSELIYRGLTFSSSHDNNTASYMYIIVIGGREQEVIKITSAPRQDLSSDHTVFDIKLHTPLTLFAYPTRSHTCSVYTCINRLAYLVTPALLTKVSLAGII